MPTRTRYIPRLSADTATQCLQAAVAAPSIHNTQPWFFRVRGREIEVWVDRARQLSTVDPAGRQMFISVGAATFNLRLALLARGRIPVLRLLPEPGCRELAARIQAGPTTAPSPTAEVLAAEITRRHTNRRPFHSAAVPWPVLDDLIGAAAVEGARLTVADPIVRDAILSLTSTADEILGRDARYRAELDRWTGGGSGRRDGIPAYAYPPRDVTGRLPLRHFGPSPEAATFERRPTLVRLATRDDTPYDWVRAGQALQRVLLTAATRRLAARLMSGMLDRRYPLWRLWLVTGLAGGRVAVVLKLHHVLADGIAAIDLVLSAVGTRAPDGPPWVPSAPPGWGRLVADNLRGWAAAVRRFAPRSAARRLAVALRGHRRMLATLRHAARTSLNAPVGPHRRLAVVRVELAEAKRVAHRHGGKVNDVVLSLAAAGVRALLQSRGEPVDGLWLHATVAMALGTPERPAEGGNRAGGVVVRLPAGEPDPAARLTLVAARSALAKRDQPPAAGNALLVWLARLGIARYFSRNQHMVHIVESNLAGPPAPVRLFGAPVLDVVPIGNLAGNIGVSFLALSYAGRLVVTVQADADRFADLPVLVAGMRREWAMLADRSSVRA